MASRAPAPAQTRSRPSSAIERGSARHPSHRLGAIRGAAQILSWSGPGSSSATPCWSRAAAPENVIKRLETRSRRRGPARRDGLGRQGQRSRVRAPVAARQARRLGVPRARQHGEPLHQHRRRGRRGGAAAGHQDMRHDRCVRARQRARGALIAGRLPVQPRRARVAADTHATLGGPSEEAPVCARPRAPLAMRERFPAPLLHARTNTARPMRRPRLPQRRHPARHAARGHVPRAHQPHVVRAAAPGRRPVETRGGRCAAGKQTTPPSKKTAESGRRRPASPTALRIKHTRAK